MPDMSCSDRAGIDRVTLDMRSCTQCSKLPSSRPMAALAALIALLCNACATDETESHGAPTDASSDNAVVDSVTCPKAAGTVCASSCGSDSLVPMICDDGEWRCPDGSVHGYDDCPPGTCFGPPVGDCCSPTGERVPPYCEPFEGGLPSGGCADGYTWTPKDTPCGDGGAP